MGTPLLAIIWHRGSQAHWGLLMDTRGRHINCLPLKTLDNLGSTARRQQGSVGGLSGVP